MVSNIGTHWGNQALNFMFNATGRTVWASLHKTDPGVGGNPGSEVTGGGYERQKVDFTQSNGKSVANKEVIKWDNMPYETVRYIGMWSDDTDGYIIAYAMLPTAVTVAAGKTYVVKQYRFAVTL